jgi:putative Mg2+ transporter-C (MgtC) family protein
VAIVHEIPLLAAITDGQGLKQVGELALAFGLSSLIGLEREWRNKSAGLRTHTLVGAGAALFMLVSKFGFGDVVGGNVTLDPSRIAAQIVSGIGFIGGGLIFVRGDAVRGLTTAATAWTTAAIGMACGAGLALLAILATIGHFIVVMGYPALANALPRSRYVGFRMRVVYEDGHGILREVLAECTRLGFTIAQVRAHQIVGEGGGIQTVAVTLDLRGQPTAQPLTSELTELTGVLEVEATDLARVGE